MYNVYKILLLLVLATPAMAGEAEWLDYRGMAELKLFDNNASTNWYRGGFAKGHHELESPSPVRL